MRFQDALQTGQFIVTTDVLAPRGILARRQLADLEPIRGFVHGVNAADMPGARLRAGALAMSLKVKELGLEPILQVTCRDRNRLSLQSELLSAGLLGIENMLILRGDGLEQTDQPGARPVFDWDTPTLLRAARAMEKGADLAGNPLRGAPRFCLGAALDPGREDWAVEADSLRRKVDAGAEFLQTQPVFAADDLAAFLAKVGKPPVPVLGGVFLLASAGMARFLNSNVPGVTVPEEIVNRLEKGDPAALSVDLAVRLVRDLADLCAGVHIMMVNEWHHYIPEILARAGVTVCGPAS